MLKEVKECIYDDDGNQYPPEEKVAISCTETDNCNDEETINILKEVIFPEFGIF